MTIHEHGMLTSRQGMEWVESVVLSLLRQLLQSLKLLDMQGILHCDIKRESSSSFTRHQA